MAQTFTDWSKVPRREMSRINAMFSGHGTVYHEASLDANKKPITVYRLASWKVAENIAYLTIERKCKLFDIAAEHGLVMDSFLHSLHFESENIRIHNEVFYIPGIIVGTWPGSNLFGGMDETGYIHT